VIRSFVSVPAGIFEVPFVRYTLLTLAGSAIWCFAFAGAGYAAGEAWDEFHHAFRYVEVVVAAAIIGGAGWIAWRYLKRRRARVAEDSSGA
jgi:membrane protein DedA with SNARE-associated domain